MYGILLLLGAHGETFAEQSASRATLFCKVLAVCDDFLVTFLPREPKNQKSNWFDNFCLARHFAHRVRSYEHLHRRPGMRNRIFPNPKLEKWRALHLLQVIQNTKKKLYSHSGK